MVYCPHRPPNQGKTATSSLYLKDSNTGWLDDYKKAVLHWKWECREASYGMSSVALFNVVALLFNVFALLFNKYILSFNVCAFIFNIYNCHSMHFHLYSMYPIIIWYIRICIQCSKLFDKITFIFNVLYYYSIFKFDSIILILFAMLQFMFERNAMVIQ